MPSASGYNKIVGDFNAISKELEGSLRGKGVTSKLKDF
jgi:hypothetical protein